MLENADYEKDRKMKKSLWNFDSIQSRQNGQIRINFSCHFFQVLTDEKKWAKICRNVQKLVGYK